MRIAAWKSSGKSIISSPGWRLQLTIRCLGRPVRSCPENESMGSGFLRDRSVRGWRTITNPKALRDISRPLFHASKCSIFEEITSKPKANWRAAVLHVHSCTSGFCRVKEVWFNLGVWFNAELPGSPVPGRSQPDPCTHKGLQQLLRTRLLPAAACMSLLLAPWLAL